MMALIALLSVAACSRGADDDAVGGRLTRLPVDPASVTVSGISSGGAMAVQFHVAYSGVVHGAGVLAGQPYLCAEGSVANGLGRCIKGEPPIPTARLIERTRQLAAEGAIDAVGGLQDDRVWIFRGAADPYVGIAVADALEAHYRAFVDPLNVVRVELPGTSHTFPTADTSVAPCDVTASPFLGNCGFDGAATLLGHLYGGLAPGGEPLPAGLVEFDQRPYASDAGSAGLATKGLLYVPRACSAGTEGVCRLHVVFHGCKQGTSFVGDAFARRSGYLPVAEANSIVLLFPQIEPSFQPLNAFGCWDWWGYEDENYAARDGRQLRAVRAMVADLLGEARPTP